MYRAPLVVGVSQCFDPFANATVEQKLADLGQNTGNMMFTEALTRAIDGAAWSSFLLNRGSLEGRDAIVIAAANWINSYDDFGWLAQRLEATNLPVFLIGVGAQASSAMETPSITPGTLRLLALVRDRSVSIAARGTFSCDVLAHYGFRDVVPTGCPSMMMIGPKGPQTRPAEHVTVEECCMHATRHHFHKADAFQTYLYRQAFVRNIDLVLQSETADMILAQPESVERSVSARLGDDVLRSVYDCADIDRISSFLTSHGRAFYDVSSWTSYMRTKAFCFGTRIHGTVASIVAGVPATLISHDSRTVEMARAMSIPVVSSATIDTSKDISIEDLLLQCQRQTTANGFHEYYTRFSNFFQSNGLRLSEQFRVASSKQDAFVVGGS